MFAKEKIVKLKIERYKQIIPTFQIKKCKIYYLKRKNVDILSFNFKFSN